MSKTRRWVALALAAALFLGALAPTAAQAYQGDRPVDQPSDAPWDPTLNYGDPEPVGGGSPMLMTYFAAWKQILLASMRIRLALPMEPVRASSTGAIVSTGPAYRGQGN